MKRVLLMPLLAVAVLAGTGQMMPPTVSSVPGIAQQDTVAMLVVLVRFVDDTAGDCGRYWCTPDAWPYLDDAGQVLPYTTLPSWARDGFIEPRPSRVRADSLTLADSSLSAYFYWQSMAGPSGPHVVYGEVWPEVYVSRRPNRAYYNSRMENGVPTRQDGGYGYLTEELLDDLTARGLDPGRFDHDGDGVLDHLMMIVRRDSLFREKGWAALSGVYQARGAPDRDGDRRPDDLRYWSPSRQDSVRVDWSRSGSQNFVSNGRRNLLVHEYGHLLFDMGHLSVIPFDPDGERRDACGYARMCGIPYGYDPASFTLAAHERRRMGWLDATVLDPTQDREDLALRDLYTSGEAVFIPLGEGGAADTLTIANRRRSNYFDAVRAIPREHPNFDFIYYGLGDTGLHIALSEGNPRGNGSQYRYGLLPADGHFAALSWCTGAQDGCYGQAIYDGDFFGPDKPQLSPWTRPTSGGFATNELRGSDKEGEATPAPLWFALDRIRYRPGPDSVMAFDFIADVRQRPAFLDAEAAWPAFRADSWLGPESDGLVFPGRATLDPGRTLYIGADTTGGLLTTLGPVEVTFGGGLELGPEAHLVIGPEAVLVVEDGVLGGPGARITLMDGATIRLGNPVAFQGASLEGTVDARLRRRFRPRF